MLMTDSVMRAKQPRLQVREGDVDYWQVCIGSLGIAIEHQEFVRVALPRQIIVAPPTIGAHDSALCHILLHELRKYLGVAVWHDTQSQSTRVIRSLALSAIGVDRPLAYLNGPNDRRLMVNAASFALGTAAHKRLIHFDRILGSDSVALRSHHARAQLVEHLECRLVARQAQLPLKLESRLAGRLRRYEVSAPEPRRQWCVAGLHDGAGRKRNIGKASTASQNHRRSLSEAVRLANIPALETRKPVRPSQVFKVSCAGRVIGKDPLKFGECRREATRVHAGNLGSDHRFGKQPDRHGSNSPPTRNLWASCATSSVSISIRPPMPSSSRSMKRARSRRSTALSPACR